MFGSGPQLAAQCPRVAPPDGWRAWTDADGPIPEPIARRATEIAADESVPLGTTESHPLAGTAVLVRVEPRAWQRQGGELVEGCFRAGAIYVPSSSSSHVSEVTPPAQKPDTLARTVTILTAVSLVIGIGATVLRGRK